MFSAKNSRIIARSFFNIFFFYLSKNRYVFANLFKTDVIARQTVSIFTMSNY